MPLLFELGAEIPTCQSFAFLCWLAADIHPCQFSAFWVVCGYSALSVLCHLCWLRRFILFNPLPFTLNIIKKIHFYVTCNDILEKRVISLPSKKTFCNRYAIFFILLSKYMKNPIIQLALFSYFSSNSREIVNWNELRSNDNSRVLLRLLHSTNYLKSSWMRSDECPGLGSSLTDASHRIKLWKPVSHLTVSNDTLAINTGNYLECFWSIFVILQLAQH